MSRAEMTYNELLASPDLKAAAEGLSDSDLVQVRGWLACGERSGWVAAKVQGTCILESCERFEREVMDMQHITDMDHGMEVGL